jgi:large subunit ribosomal protein L9
MRVILKADVESLGKTGDLVKVSDGYARNFLIPRGFAAEASSTNVKALEREKAIITRKAEKERKNAEVLLASFAGLSVTIARRVGAQDKLFGSVTTRDIELELAAKGFQVDRKNIVLADAVKSVGEYPVKIKLHPGIAADIVLKVVEEN